MTTLSSGKTAVLFLDVEGGWGGSSRSLYYLIEAMDRKVFDPIVLVRKDGPVAQRYARLGVACHLMPELSAFRPSERKNIIAFAMFVWGLRNYPSLLRRVRSLVRAHDIRLVHVNHESLTLTGWLLSWNIGLPWIAHNRTSLIPGWFARRVHRLMMKQAAAVISITRPVLEHVRASAGDMFDGDKTSVVHNIVPKMEPQLQPLPELTKPKDRFRVLSLTNFSPNRGVHRIVDVAQILRRRDDARFAFYLCGRPANTKALTGKVDPYFENVLSKVHALELQDMVFFPGHVSEPERALAACDALIKLTTQSNPWGRDIMEALAAGLPVVTLGRFQAFVENGVNGYIEPEFRPESVADYLQHLADDPALCRQIGAANRAKAEKLFDPSDCARAVEAIYRRVLAPVSGREKKTQEKCAALRR